MTVSVLDPELGDAGILEDNQIADILKQNRPGISDIIKKGTAKGSNSLLHSIVEGIMSNTFERYEASTQTMTVYNDLDLDHKLQMIEEFHTSKVKQDTRSAKQLFEERLKDMDDRFKLDL